jgi:hypothetical protein
MVDIIKIVMKKILYSLLIVFSAFACADDNFNSAFRQYTGLNTGGLPTNILEDTGIIEIPVVYGGKLTGESFTVNYKVTGGTYGTNYTIVGGTSAEGSVTVPAGDAGKVKGLIKIKGIPDLLKETSVALTVTLTSSVDGISVGYPYKNSYSFTIDDDDCDYVEASYIKTAQGRETYTDESCYPDDCTSTYDVVFTKTGTNTLTADNFWDSGWNLTMVIDPVNLTITIPSQSPVTGATVSGSGTVATCSKTMTFSTHIVWPSQNYDDTNVNIYKF